METKTGRTRSFEESIFTYEKHGNIRIINYQPGNATKYNLMITTVEEFSRETCLELGINNHYWIINRIRSRGHGKSVTVVSPVSVYDIEPLSDFPADRIVLAEFINWLMDKSKE